MGGAARCLSLTLLLLSPLLASAQHRCRLGDVRQPDGSFQLGSCEELLLFGESVGDGGAIKLAAALAGNTKLQLVDLWHNGVGAAGAKALGAAIAKNTVLKRLYLNENPLGAEGAKGIAAGLAKARGLRHLWLTRTNAGDEGAAALATALAANHVLEALDMWECGISGAGAEAIAVALKGRHDGLRTLELRGNAMGDRGARAFAALLPTNKPLSTLDLLNTGVSAEGRALLREGLRKAASLPYMVLFEDAIGPHQQRTSWEEKGQKNAP